MCTEKYIKIGMILSILNSILLLLFIKNTLYSKCKKFERFHTNFISVNPYYFFPLDSYRSLRFLLHNCHHPSLDYQPRSLIDFHQLSLNKKGKQARKKGKKVYVVSGRRRKMQRTIKGTSQINFHKWSASLPTK